MRTRTRLNRSPNASLPTTKIVRRITMRMNKQRTSTSQITSIDGKRTNTGRKRSFLTMFNTKNKVEATSRKRSNKKASSTIRTCFRFCRQASQPLV